jgi:hexosaminidase
MRSFFSIFFCSIFGAMAIAPSIASAQNATMQIVSPAKNPPSTGIQIAKPYDNSLNPGIIPAPQHIEVSPRGGYTKFKKKVSRLNTNLPAEGYKLIIEKKQITIEFADNNGLDYGNNTLLQIMDFYDDEKIPCMTITDHPRFRYRGIHLDVSRHFFDIGFLFKYAELASNYRFNVIHLHLTDDQGWRFESKRYPKLNTISSTRAGTQTGPYSLQHFDSIYYGGLYTQDQLTNFAKDCHDSWGITVIPEIEMPGHALAALAAYPELSCSGGPFEVAKGWGVFDDVFCAGNDATFTFLQNILQETMHTFPNSPYIHIGGDECPKERWKHCPKCQQRMKDNGLKDEHELQSYFIQRIEKYLQDSGWYFDFETGDSIQGRSIIGWDEILEGGLAPKATVMSWRGVDGGIAAAQQHHNAIMTPGKPLYWDHYQSKDSTEPHAIGGYNPVENVYAYDPIPAALPDSLHRYILGAQANVWTEYILTPEHVEYMVMPRLPALSEVLWSDPKQKDFNDFKRRLTEHRKDWYNINYCPTVFGEPATFFRNGNKK